MQKTILIQSHKVVTKLLSFSLISGVGNVKLTERILLLLIQFFIFLPLLR